MSTLLYMYALRFTDTIRIRDMVKCHEKQLYMCAQTMYPLNLSWRLTQSLFELYNKPSFPVAATAEPKDYKKTCRTVTGKAFDDLFYSWYISLMNKTILTLQPPQLFPMRTHLTTQVNLINRCREAPSCNSFSRRASTTSVHIKISIINLFVLKELLVKLSYLELSNCYLMNKLHFRKVNRMLNSYLWHIFFNSRNVIKHQTLYLILMMNWHFKPELTAFYLNQEYFFIISKSHLSTKWTDPWDLLHFVWNSVLPKNVANQ